MTRTAGGTSWPPGPDMRRGEGTIARVKRKSGGAVGLVRRLIRWGIRVAAVLVLTPLVLLPLYRFVDPPVSTLMAWEILQGHRLDRRWVPLDEISPNLVKAVISSEDGRFCSHSGIDWTELRKVVEDEDGPSRGASTLTMQLVKNLFLWPSRSYIRKGLELPLALYADLVLPKRRIMEIYLNIAEWGPQTYGAEAAARRAFKRPAGKLTAMQAALLAAALPNPAVRDAAKPTRSQRAHAGVVARRMRGADAYVQCVLGKS